MDFESYKNSIIEKMQNNCSEIESILLKNIGDIFYNFQKDFFTKEQNFEIIKQVTFAPIIKTIIYFLDQFNMTDEQFEDFFSNLKNIIKRLFEERRKECEK